LSARLADPVRVRLELDQRALDLAQGVPQGRGQRLGFTALSGHLARIGEVLVVGEPAVLAHAELAQLLAQLGPLLLQGGAQISESCIARHAGKPTRAYAAWRADAPIRRHGAAFRWTPACTPGWSRSGRGGAAP